MITLICMRCPWSPRLIPEDNLLLGSGAIAASTIQDRVCSRSYLYGCVYCVRLQGYEYSTRPHRSRLILVVPAADDP